MKNQLEQILQQDMTRKEFLKYVGGALLAAIGITSLLKSLMQPKPIQQSSFGYGGGAYGGGAKKAL